MKKIVLSLILFFAILKNSYGQENIGTHIAAGFLIGGGVNFIPKLKVNERPGKAVWIGGVAGLAAGLTKEFHDYILGSPVNRGDIFNTVFGGFIGGIAAREIHGIINRKKMKKNKLVTL